MSKFDELCQANATSRNNYFNYVEECRRFARQLINGLLDNWIVPKGNLRYFPTNEEPDSAKNYTLAGGLHLDDDTYCHLGVEMILDENMQTIPQQAISIIFHIKKQDDGRFIVKVDSADPGHLIDANSASDNQQFYDFLFQLIKDNLETDLQRFLQSKSTRRIGFIHS